MKGNYISPAKNAHGVPLPCPDNHPDITDKKERELERTFPEYDGVSNEFRMLFRVPGGMTVPELFQFIERAINK